MPPKRGILKPVKYIFDGLAQEVNVVPKIKQTTSIRYLL